MALSLFILMPIILSIGVWLVHEYRLRLMNRQDPETRIYQDIETCEWIIDGFGMTDEVSNSERKPLKSRAIPNQRLVRAFGIDNAFTTTDWEYYQHFKKQAEQLLKISDERWTQLALTATQLVAFSLQGYTNEPERTEIPLVTFVQKMVLKFSIHVLFPESVNDLDDDAIATIAAKINSLWISSKQPQTPKSMRSDQRALQAALRKIFPLRANKTPRDNPLNLILPAYETMWRVVLRCFLEVAFRPHNSPHTPLFRQTLARFLSDPRRATFETPVPSPEAGAPLLTAAHIVDEALRLYPPTRRIYRHQQLPGRPPVLLAADIESLHRDPGVWGTGALRFEPARWVHVGEEGRRVFLPFGARKFACPARRDVGPRMVGVLVAALVGGFGEGWMVEAVGEDGVLGGEPLGAGRGWFGGLVVREGGG